MLSIKLAWLTNYFQELKTAFGKEDLVIEHFNTETF